MKCKMCGAKLRLRKTKPYTAASDGHLYFNYYQCPKCGVNYCKPKEGVQNDSDHSG